MNLKELEEAAFWDLQVCLDCRETLETGEWECPLCDSPHVAPAAFLISFLEEVGEGLEK